MTLVAIVTALGIGLYLLRTPPIASAWHAAALETSGDGSLVKLADGSRLELSSNTRVEMLKDDPRSVAIRLSHGHVVCDLAKNLERRFSVFAADVEVRVTGTRFSVEYDPALHRTNVAVERGSVLVLDTKGATTERALKAGERWTGSQPWSSAEPALAPSPQPSTAESARALGGANLVEQALSASVLAIAPQPGTAESARALGGAAPNTSLAREVVLPTPNSEPLSARDLFDQGNAARRAGDTSTAARAYQALLTKFPNDSRAGLSAFELGRLRMGPLRDLPGAVKAFKTAVALLPGSAFREDAMARLVEAYAASGQIEPCRSARAAYLRDYPNGVHAALVGRQCGKP